MTEKKSRTNSDEWSDCLADFFELHGNELRLMILSLTKPEDVDDIFQEVFLRIYRMGSLSEISNPRSFMFVIAKNIIIDTHRKVVRSSVCSFYEGDLSNVASNKAAPEAILIANQSLRLLCTALHGLPAMRRKVFVMHRIECRPYEDISNELDVDIGALRQHVARAVRDCKSFIDQAYSMPCALTES